MIEYRMHSGYRIKTFVVVALSCLLFILTGEASAMLTAKANHDHINIDFFYHGSTVSVRGIAETGTDLIIKIASPEGNQTLRKKGKVGGFLWMNVGTLEFKHAPALYFLHSTRNLKDILSQEEIDKHLLGYAALRKHMEIVPLVNQEEKAKWFKELLKFKEASKLYATSVGKISTTVKDGKQNYYIKLDWPYQASPGNYTVTVYAVKDKKVIEKAQANVLVEKAGIVKSLANMAKSKGAVYGIISIVAALGTGLGVGTIFTRGKGAH